MTRKACIVTHVLIYVHHPLSFFNVRFNDSGPLTTYQPKWPLWNLLGGNLGKAVDRITYLGNIEYLGTA